MGVTYYLQVLVAFAIIGALLFVFYKALFMYKKNIYKGDIVLKERLSVDNQTTILLIKYQDDEFLIANNQKSLMLLKKNESKT